MSELISSIIGMLNPLPSQAAGGQLVGLFTFVIFSLTALGLWEESVRALRALRLQLAVRELGEPKVLPNVNELKQLLNVVTDSARTLRPGAERLLSGASDQEGQVRVHDRPKELFSADRLRDTGGLALLSTTVLQGLPGLLVMLGVLGAVAGAVTNLQAVGDTPNALTGALAVGGQALVLGLLGSAVLGLVSRWSQGRAELSTTRLMRFVEGGVIGADPAGLVAQLIQEQSYMREVLARNGQALHTIATAQQTSSSQLEALNNGMRGFGTVVNEAFAGSIRRDLGPTLDAIRRLSEESSKATLDFVSTTSTQQVDGVERLVGSVMDGVDRAIGHHMREAGEALAAISRTQQRNLQSWTDSVQAFAILTSHLKEAVEGIEHGAKAMHAAAEPVSVAADAFRQAAKELGGAIPDVQALATSYTDARQAMDHAAARMEQAAGGYGDAAEKVRLLTVEMQIVVDSSADRVGAAVDHAVLASMREAGTQLESFTKAQQAGLEAWNQSSTSLASSALELRTTTEGMVAFGERMQLAAKPTEDAAASLSQAAERLNQTLPLLDTLTDAQDRARRGLDDAVAGLKAGGDVYSDAAERVAGSVLQLEQANNLVVERLAQGVEEAFGKPLDGVEKRLAALPDVLLEPLKASQDELAERSRAMLVPFDEVQQRLKDLPALLLAPVEASGEALLDRSLALLQPFEAVEQKLRALPTELLAPLNASNDELKRRSEALLAPFDEIEQKLRALPTELLAPLQAGGEALIIRTRLLLEPFDQTQERLRSLPDDVVGPLEASGERLIALTAALTEPLKLAGDRMESLSKAQVAQLSAWETSLKGLIPTLEALRVTGQTMDGIAERFKEAAEPTAAAGAAFKEAAQEVGRIVPQLESTVMQYGQLNQAVGGAATELATSSDRYARAAEVVAEAAEGVSRLVQLQQTTEANYSATLEKAARFADSLPAVTDGVRSAATQFKTAATESGVLMQRLERAVISQGQTVGKLEGITGSVMGGLRSEAQRLSEMREQMELLHKVLDGGVKSFADQLPASIDHTLVHFDAAMAQGVERLGSAVERLREAMDDLQEQLEGLLGDQDKR